MARPIETGLEVTTYNLLASRVNLAPLTADPTDAIDGDIWYRADLDTIRVKLNGSVVTVQTA